MGKRKHTTESVKIEFEKNNCELLSTEYTKYTDKLDYICSCGNYSSITFKNFIKGRRCRECAKEKTASSSRLSFEEVFNLFEKENCILLSSEYKNSKNKLSYICSCGNPDSKTLSDFKKGRRCTECSSRHRRDGNLHSFEYVYNFFKVNNCELISTDYLGGHLLLDYKCSCGRFSKISFYSFSNGSRCRQCFIDKNKGEKHHNWNPAITNDEREIKRNFEEYRLWRLSVYERDNYTCQICKDDMGGNLNAHHLDGYDWCIEKRVDIDNGITICEICHNLFHKSYGFGKNTIHQFKEWRNVKCQ